MKNSIEISTDSSKIDFQFVHKYLSEDSYWTKGIPLDTVKKSIENSLCFSVFLEKKQMGFGRVVTDRATFAYLADVFIDESYRGLGYSKKLIAAILSHSDLQGIRRWMLVTKDAHGLYDRFGFTVASKPERMMEITIQDIYKNI